MARLCRQLHFALAPAQVAKLGVKAAQSLILKDELKHMQRVLRRLGYVDAQGVITIKGKVRVGGWAT